MAPKKSGKSIREYPSDLHEAVLVILLPHGEKGAYGLNIMDEINEVYKKSGLKDIDMGSLYPAFKRMSEKGWIEGRWGDDAIKDEESSGARRRYYSITSSGKSILSELWLYRKNLQDNVGGLIPGLAHTALAFI